MKLLNDGLVKEIGQVVRDKFQKFPEIISAYLYGSILSDKFSEASDIDILFIVKNLTDTRSFFDTIKASRESIGGHSLDVNVVFEREFNRLWHIYRPPTYFYWIKKRGNLLWGDDLISTIQESNISPESIYRRAVDLAQSCRSVYLNDKDDKFWETKYRRWLRTLVSEIYYLEGGLKYDFEFCINELSKNNSELIRIIGLTPDVVSIKDLSDISESLASYVNNKYIIKK